MHCRPGVQLCLGIRQVKKGALRSDESQRQPPNIHSYQFGCMGYSAHSYERQDGSRGLIFPYCEGIEVRHTHARASILPTPSFSMISN